MKTYTIKMHARGIVGNTIGLLEYTLGEDLKWYLACNNPARFLTVSQARNYAEKYQIVQNRPQLESDTCPFIFCNGRRTSIFKR
jgi:hypothetical protein